MTDFAELNGTTSACNLNDTSTLFDLRNPLIADQWLRSGTETLVVNLIIPVLSTVGVLGNGAFLFMVVRLPELRTSLNAFLANLAVCDIMFLLFANFWYAVYSSHSPVALTLDVKSAIGCAFYTITTRIWYSASMAIMTLISVERFYAICRPLQHRRLRGYKRTFKLLLAIWSASVLLTISLVPERVVFSEACLMWPPTEAYKDMPTKTSLCDPIHPVARPYAVLLAIVILLIALVDNFALYLRIILALQQRPVASASDVDETQKSKSDRVRNQVARTLILNGIVFFVCQTPYRLASFDEFLTRVNGVGILNPSLYNFVVVIGQACLFLNSVINPYLYVFSCQFYRKAMIKAFGCCCTPTPATLSNSEKSTYPVPSSTSAGTSKSSIRPTHVSI